jgi:hypothetical protein
MQAPLKQVTRQDFILIPGELSKMVLELFVAPASGRQSNHSWTSLAGWKPALRLLRFPVDRS